MLGSVRLTGRVAAGLAAAAVVAGAATGCASQSTPAAAPAATGSVAASSAASPASASASSSAAPSPSSSPAPTVQPSHAPSPSAKPSATPSPVPSNTSSTTACATRYLAAKVGIGQGAAGSVYQVIDFTNISSAPCTLYGYPGVSLAAGSPVTQVGAAAARSSATSASVITLAPGATANALLRITQAQNYPAKTCSPRGTTYLQIYPPDQYTPLYLAYKSTGCEKTAVKLLTISVMAKGTGG